MKGFIQVVSKDNVNFLVPIAKIEYISEDTDGTAYMSLKTRLFTKRNPSEKRKKSYGYIETVLHTKDTYSEVCAKIKEATE